MLPIIAQYDAEYFMTTHGPSMNPGWEFPTLGQHSQPAPAVNLQDAPALLHAYRVIDEGIVDQSLGSIGFRMYKIYVCLVCDRQFGDLLTARLHIHKHWGTYQPLACMGCNARFTLKASAQRHVANRVKRFRCWVCLKSYARADYLLTHRENCARRMLA